MAGKHKKKIENNKKKLKRLKGRNFDLIQLSCVDIYTMIHSNCKYN